MNLEQQRRYARQIMLKDVGEAGQQKLLDARVLVIGAGGLGSALISYLAAAGVGHLGIIDDDRVELSNLARQIIHETGDIGRLKVESASDRIAELNPEVTVTTYPFALTAENAGEIIGGNSSATHSHSPPAGESNPSSDLVGGHNTAKESPYQNLQKGFGSPSGGEREPSSSFIASTGYDIVADGCDNFSTRFVVNAECIKQKKPLVSAAVVGWSGQVMTIAPCLAPESGCYQCLVNPEAREANTCRETGIIGPLAGVIGSIQALEVVNAILGRPALIGKLALYDAHTMTQRISALPRDAACPVCG